MTTIVEEDSFLNETIKDTVEI